MELRSHSGGGVFQLVDHPGPSWDGAGTGPGDKAQLQKSHLEMILSLEYLLTKCGANRKVVCALWKQVVHTSGLFILIKSQGFHN